MALVHLNFNSKYLSGSTDVIFCCRTAPAVRSRPTSMAAGKNTRCSGCCTAPYFKAFRAYAEELGLNAEFIEVEGYNHEWRFWEREIQNAIETFLPGKEKASNAF